MRVVAAVKMNRSRSIAGVQLRRHRARYCRQYSGSTVLQWRTSNVRYAYGDGAAAPVRVRAQPEPEQQSSANRRYVQCCTYQCCSVLRKVRRNTQMCCGKIVATRSHTAEGCCLRIATDINAHTSAVSHLQRLPPACLQPLPPPASSYAAVSLPCPTPRGHKRLIGMAHAMTQEKQRYIEAPRYARAACQQYAIQRAKGAPGALTRQEERIAAKSASGGASASVSAKMLYRAYYAAIRGDRMSDSAETSTPTSTSTTALPVH